jgi:hypothetical protein
LLLRLLIGALIFQILLLELVLVVFVPSDTAANRA